MPDLPRHDEAEKAVLGGILVDANRVFDVAGTLRPEHFHGAFNRPIYAAILKLAKDQRPIDPLTVHSALGSKEITLGQIFGLTEGVPRGMNVGYYGGLVVNAAKLREAVLTAKAVIEAATTPAANAVDVLEQAQAAYFGIASQAERKTLFWSDEMTLELASEIQGDTTKPVLPPLMTGVETIDALFEGFEPGDLAFLAGRPSTGKTTLAQQIAVHVATERTVLVCSMEMSHAQIWRRTLAAESRVAVPRHRRRPFTAHEETLVGQGLARIGKLHLAIENMRRGSDMQVLSTARRVQMQRGLSLIVVDYLQLMRAEGRFRSRHEELETLTRSLKDIAGQLEVPILVLAALTRAADNERPLPSHIRECGSAEYDADHVFLMHRDVQAQENLEPGAPSPAELIIGKQRNGPTGSVPILYYGDTYRFVSGKVA